MQPGYTMGPVLTLNSQQPDANSTWTFPVASAPAYTLATGGILYLNITGIPALYLKLNYQTLNAWTFL